MTRKCPDLVSMAVAATVAALLWLVPSAADPEASSITVTDPWTRASPGRAANAAVFLTIRNAGPEPDRLTGADSPAARTAHLHETTTDGGIVRMRPVDALLIPAGGSVTLKPHGLHIMIMQLHAPLAEGHTVALVLTFEKAGRIEIEVPVAGPGATASPQTD